jgi:hypothetical protein
MAEILRRLSQKADIDPEGKDMTATLVYLLREINDGVEKTVAAWEKRDYWMKADRFMRDWEWVKETAVNIEDVIRHDAWDLMPELLADLFPRFADIQLKTMTRTADLWRGNYQRLMAEEPSELPW